MDYHDNDYEDQNLHLAGEESSKVSSVLRPFTLPKFDFDDNLHGHLRFDSLVENEVFLDIPSQEDNHWIEDFSRGTGEIVFSSSVTKSCALPRNDNVWSEATSSESVEMLLKAVGQEEMVLDENVVEESNPVDQLGCSTKQMELNLKQDGKLDEVDDENSSLLVVEAVRDISRSNRTIEVDDIDIGCMLEGHETELSSYGVHNNQECSLTATSENLHTGMESTSDNPGQSGGLVNESLFEQVPPVPSIEIANTEGSTEIESMRHEELGVQDAVSDIGFASTSFVAESVFEAVNEHNEVDSTRDEIIRGSDDHAVDIHVKTIVESTILPVEGESASSFAGFEKVGLDVEPLCAIACETAALSLSSQEINKLSEDCNEFPKKSSISLGGSMEGICMKGSHLEDLGNSIDSSYTGECCMEKAVIEDVADVRDATIIPKDHASPPLLARDTQTGGEDVPSVQVDVRECERDVSACDKVGSKLHLDSEFIPLDDVDRDMGSTVSGQGVEVNIETAIGPHIYVSVRDFPVLDSEVKGTMLASPLIQEEDYVADCDVTDTPSHDMKNMDKSKDNELEANAELITSISKESFEAADKFTPGTEPGKSSQPDSSAAGGSKTADQPDFSLETSSSPMFDETSKELIESTEHPACHLIVQNDVLEAEKPKEVDVESSVANYSLVPAAGSAIELDESNQLSPACISLTEFPQSRESKLPSPKINDDKNTGSFQSTPLKLGANFILEEEGTFTFGVRQLGSHSGGSSGTGLPSIPSIQACKSSAIGEGSPSTSGSSKVDPMTMKEISGASSLTPDGKSLSGGHKGSTERKSRRGRSKSGKESVKKGNQVKETPPLRQTQRGDKSCGSLRPLMAGQVMKFESIPQPRGAVSIPTSSLPDLNTSATPSFFQQPFTDLQQVQLRAQIFVYGSLIQGVAPDEACMDSSFDGNRSIWEPTWRACVKRLNRQKSLGINTEAPVQSCTGAMVPDQVNRQTLPKTDVTSSPLIHSSNKAIPSSVVNPMISLSSPLWNISTPSCEALPSSSIPRSSVFDYPIVSPLHPFQSPPIRNLLAQTSSWPSQTPFPVPWILSSQTSPYDASPGFTAFPIAEPVKITTPVKESSVPISSGTKHVSSIPAIHTGGTVIPETSSIVDLKKATASAVLTSANSKARKRKKSSGAEEALKVFVTASPVDDISASVVSSHLSKKASAVQDLSQISLLARGLADSLSTPVVNSHYSTSVTVTTPSSIVPKGTSNMFFSALLPTVSSDHHKSGDLSMDKRTLNAEEFSKVEEAKLQAEEASIHAVAAVRHCQVLWSQLEQQKNSGMTSDSEAKLASAAVAIAAAASVAKAAAAAAKIASSAAIQAKQMADEAVTIHGTVNNIEYDAINVSSSTSYFANATPMSILKGGDRNHPSNFVISAAREAARKRVEATSAATRHTENLDAILKAAELAADAVSHAGKIVTMGDPLPLSELVVAGPDRYWKISQVASVPNSKFNKVNPEKSNVGEGSVEDIVTSHVMLPVQRNISQNIVDDHVPIEESLVAFVKHGENNTKAHKDKNIPNPAKIIDIVLESRVEPRSNSFSPTKHESAAIIKEGSLVEVFKDQGDFGKAWHVASVLSLKDGEALVCYAKLQSDQGSELLKEWVPLDAKDGNPAILRIPHPMSSVQFEGPRKRRRGAMKDYDWSVGDKVDALVEDCWREGIITEHSKKDPTALSVHFPAQGETSVVKVWHLRPTLIWIDGQWIEWCRTGLDRIPEGDTPKEKRAKLGSTTTEEKVVGKMSESTDFAGIRNKEETKLPLSVNERAFNIGNSRVDKPSVVRNMRSGLQKEGSRGVVFGVPKPGKKRKFIEVSKHFVYDRSTKTNVPSDSVKLSKFLTAQGSGYRGWKNNDNIDSMEKQAAEVKPKVFKTRKPPTFPSRTLTQKDNSTSSQLNAIDDIEPSEQNLTEFGSLSNASECAIIFSQALPPENRKKTSTVNAKFERFNKGKLAPASGKPAKSEADEKKNSEVAEPRRSNRRIQPTSRLLEGLQSSLTMTKLPSSSLDKSHNKGTSKGNSDHSR